MAPAIQVRGPTSFKEWLSTNFWWGISQHAIGPGFSRYHAFQLFRARLWKNRDAWDSLNDCFISGLQAAQRYGLTQHEFCTWAGLRQWLTGRGNQLKLRQSSRPQGPEWYAVYSHPTAATPNYVLEAATFTPLGFPRDAVPLT